VTVATVPLQRGSSWPSLVGAVSILYALLVIFHSMARFTDAAFGPVMPGVGGDRPPIPPVELRWQIALEAIFAFSLGVLLMCAAFGLLRRQRQSVRMLGLWSIASIFVQIIFLVWAMTLADERQAYHEMADAWRLHAAQNRIGMAQPFGRYSLFLEWLSHATRLMFAVPFIYPIFVGLFVLQPFVRRETKEWN